MENQSCTLSPGTVIRGPKRSYTVLNVLGQGGFGITYLVSCKVKVDNILLEGRFALKEHFISSLCSRDGATRTVQFSTPVAEEVDRSMRAFIKEAQRLQSLGIDHPNIVRINEVFETNNTAYYVMEYLGGTTLQDYVGRNGAMSPAAAKSLLRPVVEAVAMLHCNNIAHYDIKPGNIMLHEENDGSVRPVLIDFGLSKHYNDRGHATSTLAAAGYTPGYAPAEQYAGIKQFSPQCDVYALAATLYFCLTGHDPKPAFELSAAEVEQELSAILPAAEVAPILRALSTMPAARTPDAGALLSEVFSGSPTPLPQQSEPQQPCIEKEPSSVNETVKIAIPPSPARRGFPIIAAIVAFAIVAIAAWILTRPAAPTGQPVVVNDSVRTVQVAESVPTETDVEPIIGNDDAKYSVASSVKSAKEDVKAEFTPRQDYNNLDLHATRGGKDYYFSQSEWETLPIAEQSKYVPKGVVVIGNGLNFTVALNDSGKKLTWYDAKKQYGNSLPSKEQAEVMERQYKTINDAIAKFGGYIGPDNERYWTKTEYGMSSDCAWPYDMHGGSISYQAKNYQYRARAVFPLPDMVK